MCIARGYMPKNKASKIVYYVSDFIQAQLVVTLASMPIIIGWGLSFSWVAFIGNFIFAPFLLIFLLLASLLFFAQLMQLPTAWLVAVCNFFVGCWQWLLAQGSCEWLFEFAQPPGWLLYGLPLGAFVCMRYGGLRTRSERIAVLTFFLGVSLMGFELYSRYQRLMSVDSVVLSPSPLLDVRWNDSARLVVVDNGFFSKYGSPENVVAYELKPFWIKRIGTAHIATVVMTKVGQRAFVGVRALCSSFLVDEVVMPFFNHTLSKSAWRAFFDLKRVLADKHITLTRVPLSQCSAAVLLAKHSEKRCYKYFDTAAG